MIYNVQTCPMNPADDNGESFFHVSNDNRVSFYCPHYATSHCNENQISDVIQKYDSELWEDVEAISREGKCHRRVC